MSEIENPAERASRVALEEMHACLETQRSFRLEAGAGAGKTYSLVKALRFLIERLGRSLARRGQQIACITFTNVAKEEIEARIDGHPIVFCDTNHAFCWNLIQGFQKQLREQLVHLTGWKEKIDEAGGLGERPIEYTLGHRSIRETLVSLSHDDILPLTILMMDNVKFRRIMSERFPIILIDEYQDTDSRWVEAIKTHFLGQQGSPLFGFFGDHWQKIYGGGCGRLEHSAVVPIGKLANFRSVGTIVECLNRMRPELPQSPEDPDSRGEVIVFHCNGWRGVRQTGGHWGGDLPAEEAHYALERVRRTLTEKGWDLSPDHAKILMLTHRLLATEQGYSSMPEAFMFNESFTKKEDLHIAYFVDVLEPSCDAFTERKFGLMFDILGTGLPSVRAQSDKAAWADSMSTLLDVRKHGTVGDVTDYLMKVRRPRLPDAVELREQKLREFVPDPETEMPRLLSELQNLRNVRYEEIIALRRFLDGHSPFETKHGVKGAEFENILVVVGRGWNQYNFGEMLELARTSPIPSKKVNAFERNRNLFYVACSRPKRRLALLFTQLLSDDALETLKEWFGRDSLTEITI